jgi:hypothetical protein
MSEVLLSGLEGRNPLGFLAALGALNAVADAVSAAGLIPKLCWRYAGTYRPVLVDVPEPEALLDVIVSDLRSFDDERSLQIRYRKGGDGKEAHDLKPPPTVYAQFLREFVAASAARSLSFVAALATDVIVDNNGNAKPTALHFTAGQQEFLAMVDELRRGVTKEDFREALFGPWKYARALPVLAWDNSQSRDYALRASDPSKDKKRGVPGADWLGFRGLPYLRVAPVGERLITTGCRGGWKTGFFRWPMWSAPLPRDVVTSLLTSPELFDAPSSVLEVRGVPVVFECSIQRSDQGGYGSFAPAAPAGRTATDE